MSFHEVFPPRFFAPDTGGSNGADHERNLPPLTAFIKQLREKNLIAAEGFDEGEFPMKVADVRAFATFVLKENPPEGFLQRLGESISFLSEKDFEEGIAALSTGLQERLTGRPYTIVFQENNKSGPWIFGKLRSIGFPKEDRIHVFEEDGELPESDNSLLVTVDDHSMTGSQMMDIATVAGSNRPIVMGLLRATPIALDRLQTRHPNAEIVLIKTIEPPKLEAEDYAFMQRVMKDQNLSVDDEYKLSEGYTTYMTFYMIPDTTLSFLVKGPHPLIIDSNFTRPYS